MKKMVVLYFCYEDLASSIIHYKFLCKNNFLQSKLLIKMFIFYSMYFFFPISFLRLIYFLIFQNSKNKFVHGVLYVVKYSLPFMQRYPSPQLISVKNSSKHLSNVSSFVSRIRVPTIRYPFFQRSSPNSRYFSLFFLYSLFYQLLGQS